MHLAPIARALTLVAFLSLGACASVAPRPLPISSYTPPAAARMFPGNFSIRNEAGALPRRSATVVSAEVSELYEPRFADVIATSLEGYLASRLNGQGSTNVRATVQAAGVTVERGGVDVLPVVGAVAASLRNRTFVASGSVLFEVERGGRVEQSYTLQHTTRVVGGLATDQARAASTAAAIEQWRNEAFAKADADFLARYL